MPLIPDEKIAEIRDRTNIVQVIGEYVALTKKSGPNHKGLCPFHGEKTPSFNVNSQKQIFHCFGCGKSGDVFRFLMEHDGKGFHEAIRELARRAGIDLPEPDKSPAAREAAKRAESDRARMLRVMALACEYFRGELASVRGERGRAYIDKRKIGPSVRESFLLGYAPPGWDGLTRFLESKRVPADLAERAGLVRARDGTRLPEGAPPAKATHFDLFRDRVIFPLVSAQGEVIAFGGRTLEGGDDVPKYINSPETILYKKGDNLYGLHAAKTAIRKAGRAILVEGNFDVLSMHEHGLTETVAPMGTALTREQVHVLHRHGPDKVFMFLDGDPAGFAAAAKNVGTFLDEELLAYVTLMPVGEDPDTFSNAHGRGGVELLLGKSVEAVQYFCEFAWNKKGASDLEKAKLLEEEAAPLIRKVKLESARLAYAQRLSLQLGMDAATINRAVRTGTAAPRVVASAAAAMVPSGGTASGPVAGLLTRGDLELVALLADHPQLVHRLAAIGALRCIADPALKRGLSDLVARTDSARFEVSAVAAVVDPALRGALMEAALSGRYADVPDPERALREILRKFDSVGLLAEVKRALAAARAAGNVEEVQRLSARVTELQQQRLGLKG